MQSKQKLHFNKQKKMFANSGIQTNNFQIRSSTRYPLSYRESTGRIMFKGGHTINALYKIKHKLGRGRCVPSLIKFRSAVAEKKSKVTIPIRDQGGHLCISIDLKKHKHGRVR